MPLVLRPRAAVELLWLQPTSQHQRKLEICSRTPEPLTEGTKTNKKKSAVLSTTPPSSQHGDTVMMTQVDGRVSLLLIPSCRVLTVNI